MAADTCRQLSLSEVPSWEQVQIASSLCTLMLPNVGGGEGDMDAIYDFQCHGVI